jgi:hypothetical protein
MFKEIPRRRAWRDAWRGGVGTLAVGGHPTVPDSPAASLAKSRSREWVVMPLTPKRRPSHFVAYE